MGPILIVVRWLQRGLIQADVWTEGQAKILSEQPLLSPTMHADLAAYAFLQHDPMQTTTGWFRLLTALSRTWLQRGRHLLWKDHTRELQPTEAWLSLQTLQPLHDVSCLVDPVNSNNASQLAVAGWRQGLLTIPRFLAEHHVRHHIPCVLPPGLAVGLHLPGISSTFVSSILEDPYPKLAASHHGLDISLYTSLLGYALLELRLGGAHFTGNTTRQWKNKQPVCRQKTAH